MAGKGSFARRRESAHSARNIPEAGSLIDFENDLCENHKCLNHVSTLIGIDRCSVCASDPWPPSAL
jgi:hypothetical protein